MNWRHYALLFVIGLLVPFAVSRFQSLPGYMDADYYFAGGVQLAKGNGFTEPYLWNYLDDPQGLPHPSHTYWMPLASIVSAIGMWLAGQTTYAAGRFLFILLSACVPLLTATLAFDITRQTRLAIVSGLLSIFSLYYAPFMPVPDNYALFMLLGGSFLLLAPRTQKWIPLALGALAGLMTLARSDGLLWLGLAGLTVLWKSAQSRLSFWESVRVWVIPAGLLVIAGYLLVMGGWHYRNYKLFGSFMSPGGGRLLWLENYNQTFAYPADSITREGFLNAGWEAALEDRLDALNSNLGNTFAAQGGIFLFPFMLIGLWGLRKDLRARISITGWLILFLVMTVIFPFAGSRGSFFHAGAAFQPYWWVAAPIGLDVVIKWLRGRGLFADNAYVVFQGMFVLLAVGMTFFLLNLRVFQDWAREDGVYASVEQKFLNDGISPQDVVIVRNPPGYYINSGRPAIALPFGDESVILQVAERYGASLLVIEGGGTFESIQELYDDPHDTSVFKYLGEADGAKLYRIELAR
ncbi:MAG: hypothetical protein C3F07_01170 [Anaerolineales bacterium]|nr:hypothetical protein [Anaerolineae bacterium]PWB77952.1 MAG: hypothetical protein C3F07_01170 [Anaerolineales bacterium]